MGNFTYRTRPREVVKPLPCIRSQTWCCWIGHGGDRDFLGNLFIRNFERDFCKMNILLLVITNLMMKLWLTNVQILAELEELRGRRPTPESFCYLAANQSKVGSWVKIGNLMTWNPRFSSWIFWGYIHQKHYCTLIFYWFHSRLTFPITQRSLAVPEFKDLQSFHPSVARWFWCSTFRG